jgi:uncharacterized membrane protein YqaE (UPF0057 family)
MVCRNLNTGIPAGKETGGAVCASHRFGYSAHIHTGRFTMDILRIIAAIILPPLGVFLQVGIGKHFWLNILLTLFGYVPGIIHALWVIIKK